MKTKSGYVAIIGKPNVGKSTLMNSILGEKISIVTNKPQTTRKRVLGILSDEKYQIIFLDTPGILDPNYLLQKKFMEYVQNSVNNADVLVVLVDVVNDKDGRNTLEDKIVKQILDKQKKPKILILNKIDKSNEEIVNRLVEKFEKLNYFQKIIPISALLKFSVPEVVNAIVELLPIGPKYYPDDQLTDEHERFFVSEIIREKIFEIYKEEIPFSTEVLIEEFSENEGRKDFISASIVVERETQKPIIIGKKGEAIKRVGKYAREAIEVLLGRPVFLELRVKVRPKWRSDERLLNSFGYNDNE
ncbi:MAG: GTPase Era [Bacteroidetes bacterium]|nr:GTPase Era [Bacteroidota bacterium]MBU1113681.1 GTPase Era [Bacteroidota bacterium]MBU1799100.1 GTPase Era [Bacteroidota bacterium]